jgi:HAMP domain-containing protein
VKRTHALALLQSSLTEAEALLASHGDIYVVRRLAGLRAGLARGDRTAIVTALIESTGSMGSLRDRYLCPENGDQIAADEVEEVNARLSRLVEAIRQSAEAAQ